MPHYYSGIAASKGIAIAKVFILKKPELDIVRETAEDKKKERLRLKKAFAQGKEELSVIQARASVELGEDSAAIFAAHLLVLEDPEFIDAALEKIDNENMSAERAVDDVARVFIDIFANMDNEYMQERAADIRDVSKRILAHLLGVEYAPHTAITDKSIVIAEDLTPSDTAQLNQENVKGLATDIGGTTSHSTIIARSMELPAVVGTKQISKSVENGTVVIIDGYKGEVIVDPTPEQLMTYENKGATFEAKKKEWRRFVNETTVTKDEKRIELAGNIGSPNDLDAVLENGAEGIGLYRTEFLYIGRNSLPDEDEQYEAYKVVLEKMGNKPVVIRTLDVGGDKELPSLDLPKELNPFLGVRAIRLCLTHEEIFRTQLRALLRASVHGNLHIMFPMIATLDEFLQAKTLLLEEQDKLRGQGIHTSNTIPMGMMVEIPAAAFMAKQFSKEVDFFSIGTNDLIQYMMAADRMNEHVSYLYQPYSPGVLQLIQQVISAAHNEGKWVGMCGEMAGETTAIPILLGLGLDEFSMSPASILPARSHLSKIRFTEAAKHAKKVVHMKHSREVLKYIKQIYN